MTGPPFMRMIAFSIAQFPEKTTKKTGTRKMERTKGEPENANRRKRKTKKTERKA
jgi:hypothetical protein